MIGKVRQLTTTLVIFVILFLLAILLWEEKGYLYRQPVHQMSQIDQLTKRQDNKQEEAHIVLKGNTTKFADSHQNWPNNKVANVGDGKSSKNISTLKEKPFFPTRNYVKKTEKKEFAVRKVDNDRKHSQGGVRNPSSNVQLRKPVITPKTAGDKGGGNKANSSESKSYVKTNRKKPKERFLIYLCDKTMYCYGLADRQRAIASLYALSVVVNRKFGIIWTHPCSLKQFLRPNEVNWDIPESNLKGKSSIELVFLNRKKFLNLTIPFNEHYPQEVVYIRTNHNVLFGLKKHPLYRTRLPSWIRGTMNYAIGYIWKKLMMPQASVRRPLNEMLGKIYRDQQVDNTLRRSFQSSRFCRDACEYFKQSNTSMVKNNYRNDTAAESNAKRRRSVTDCVSEVKKTHSDLIFPKGNTTVGPNEGDGSEDLTILCASQVDGGLSEANNKTNIKTIERAQGYEVVDLNLVCIHARIGRSENMPFDKPRNSIESTAVLWDFVRPYVERGQHVYLATDSNKVRKEGKARFGLRIHSSDAPIVHIATILKNQNETEGMTLALWEQLLLMTSCKTLVISHSGFSILASSVRSDLMGSKDRYMFEDGKIRRA